MTAATVARHRHRKPSRLHRLRARLHRPQWPSWLLNWAWHRQATPYAPGLLRRCRIAALWLLAVLGDWWLNWRTWQAERRDGTDLASARIWLDRLRGISPLTAARTRLAAVRAVVPASLPGAAPEHHEDPCVTTTGELAPAALPCEPLYPLHDDPRWPHLNGDRLRDQLGETGEFTDLISQMQLPARRADTF